jgi:hypothetical protein
MAGGRIAMATSDGLTEVLAAAHAQVRGVDWASWQVPPGDARIAEYIFADEPALTNGLLQGHLSTCSWIWQRPINPDEGQRVFPALLTLWAEHGHAQEYGPLLDVLSVVALSDQLLKLPPATADQMRQELLQVVTDGRFPGVDVSVPGAEAAAAIGQAKIPASTLSAPDVTGVALDGLYSATTSGLQLDITGSPGSGTWGSTIEFYAFFPDGTYLKFASANEVGAHIQDPSGHKAWHGQYEVAAATIRLYDASDGKTNSSDFSATPDGKQISFYGKSFTRIRDTANLRAST